MRDYDGGAPPFLAREKVALDAFFTKGLTDVCESVFGPRLTRRLMTEFSGVNDGLSIRNFFEIDPPGAQCVGVLSEKLRQSAIWNHCWICGTPIDINATEKPKECEHKFSILPALVVTGLYDSRLRKALISNGTHDIYREQLVNEYAYSHRRCNQVKSDVVFASLSYEGNNPRIVKCVQNPASIGATLKDILERPAEQVPTYTPRPDVLMGKLGREPAWDGKATSFSPTLPPLNPWTQDAWINARTPVIGAAIEEAAAKFNSKRLSAAIVKTHIVNAMLTRAIEISATLVEEEIWDSLSDAGRALVTQSLKERKGGRRTTRQRRKGTHRAMQGGANDDIWADIVSSRIKEYRVKELGDALEAQFTATTPKDDLEYNRAVIGVFMQHVRNTDAEINQVLETTIGALWAKTRPDDDAPSGPIRRTTGSQERIETASPLPLSPISARAATGFTTPGSRVPSSSMASTAYGSEPRTSSQYSVGTLGSPLAFSLAPAPGSVPQSPSSSGESEGMPKPPIRKRVSERGAQDGDDVDVKGGGFKFALGKRPDWL